MNESTNRLLEKVEEALWLGDQRAASILLHKILLQDFTNRQAWLLLHTIRGSEQPLEQFQRSFAQRYYPQLCHLLDQSLLTTTKSASTEKPAVAEVKTTPSDALAYEDTATRLEEEIASEDFEPLNYTLSPTAKPLFDVPEPMVRKAKPAAGAIQIAESVEVPKATPVGIQSEIEVASPESGTQPIPIAVNASSVVEKLPAAESLPVLPRVVTAPAAPQVPLPVRTSLAAPTTGAGLSMLTITRENSLSGALFKFTIWIDGKVHSKISNNELNVLTLPAGQHTIQISRGSRSSLPMAIEFNPGRNVQLFCQTPKMKSEGPRVIQLSAGRPMPVKTRWWAGWLLLMLTLACVAMGVGTVVYYFQMIAS